MKKHSTGNKINKVEITNDTLTGRGGLSLFSRYLERVGIYQLLEEAFGGLRRSKKGLPIWSLFHQVFCFFIDGTSRHLSHFDHLKKKEGYAGAIEHGVDDMASSHAIKRFFKMFSWLRAGAFRKILQLLFIWRLRLEQPDEIVMTLDTMVMDNDEALKRHGVQPTYKKVKGFQPLQAVWNGKIIDAVFRGGKKHSNYGNTVINMATDLVHQIRKKYREDVTIIIRLDSGFFDEKIFIALDKLGVGFICSGKMYENLKKFVGGLPEDNWAGYDNGHQEWSFAEFGFGCDSWDNFYRTIYTRPVYEDKQRLLDFARPDNVIVTNIGVNERVLEHCTGDREAHWLKCETIIGSHHLRGADELPHRGLKDFGFEQLPFKRFAANSAFYYCMLISFFLFEAFKEDVLADVISPVSYATTVRRKLIDIAAKIIKTGGEIILKVTKPVMDSLQFDTLWERCQAPPPIEA